MIHITFPDQSVREYEEGVTGLEIAKSLSNSLAREVLAVSVNNEIWDLTRPIREDAEIRLHKWDDDEAKHAFWHSSAHLMAEAIEAIYPGTKFGIGPAIENGFYYDVDPGEDVVITDADLPKIEKKMKELSALKSRYHRETVSKKTALDYFNDKGDEYKLELIDELEDGKKTFLKWFNFLLPIVLILLIGVYRWQRQSFKRIRRMQPDYID